MGYKFLGIIIIIASLSFVSCGETGTFLSNPSKEESILIKTASSGTVLAPGATLPLSIIGKRDEESYESMEIEIFDSNGESLGVTKLSSQVVNQNTLPPVAIPELKTGLYTAKFTLYGKDGQLAASEIQFFVVKDEYAINKILSYPPSLIPEAKSLLQCTLSIPQNTNPYLRWTVGKKVIAQGFLNDGLSKVEWEAPKEKGVYSIRVDLFPVGPKKGASFDFGSSVYLTTEIFVTDSKTIAKNELSPEDSYYSLFHFRGNLTDSGIKGSSTQVTMIGEPKIDISQDVFGYMLDGKSGFRINSLLLPVTDGMLQPFTFDAIMLFSESPKNAQLFQANSNDGKFFFKVFFSETGVISFSLRSGAEQVLCSAEGLHPNPLSAQKISISVVPQKTETAVFWYLNDALIRNETVSWNNSNIGSDGTAMIAGEAGVKGIIDELGIFFRDEKKQASARTDVYTRSKKENLGSNLVYAEGFDDLSIPDNVYISGTATTSNGKLLISPDSEITIPLEIDFSEKVGFTVECGDETEGVFSLRVGTAEEAFLSFNGKGVLLVPDKRGISLRTNDKIGFALGMTEQGIALIQNKKDSISLLKVPKEKQKGKMDLYFSIRNKKSSVFSVDSVLIKREPEDEKGDYLMKESSPVEDGTRLSDLGTPKTAESL